MFVPPKNNPEFSWRRLNQILRRRRLCFDPYSVSDERLIEIVSTTGWGSEFDIVELTSVRFTRLRENHNLWGFDGIYMRVSNSDEEIFIPNGALTRPVTANDTLRQERSWVGKKPIRNPEDVKRLVGKSFFVSRIIRGVNPFGAFKSAYRFHRLKGNVAQDAMMLRTAICDAKIEMHERLLANPQSPDYLSCRKGLINFEPHILQVIASIRRYPETTSRSQ